VTAGNFGVLFPIEPRYFARNDARRFRWQTFNGKPGSED